MRRPISRSLLIAAALVLAAVGCSDDERGGATSTTAGTAGVTTSTIEQDPDLVPLVLEVGDLPAGFSPSADVDDTITSFCANEDAAAGLQASGRALAGYTRDPAGASVIHVVFRFRDHDAATFVEQADGILQRCSAVPDATGLAFEYEPSTPSVEAVLAGTDAHTSRYGVSVGSGSLRIELAVFHHGAIGELVAVLGVDIPRAELDALATAAFTAAVARLPAD